MKKGFRILKFKKAKPLLEVKNLSKTYNGRPIKSFNSTDIKFLIQELSSKTRFFLKFISSASSAITTISGDK